MSAPSSAPSQQTGLKRIVSASMAGTVVEWYDFFLYASAAALVFGTQFFPQTGNALDGVIAAFVTYAVGFVARPLGGIIFGHIGDRLGRKFTLQLTIVMIGVATVLMGCLPTINQIGYWAPALLVFLRFVQGMALGGEWGGAVLLVAEHSPNESRGFWASWPQAAVPLGNLLATVVLFVMRSVLDNAAFLAWGWRVAFWLSAVVVVVGYIIRKHVQDAPIFEEAKAEVEQTKAISYGVGEVIKKYPRGILTAMGLRFAENILYYIVVSFSIVYLGSLKVDTAAILGLLAIAHVFHFIFVPIVGYFSDKVGRRPLYIAGAILGGTWGFFAFPMFNTKDNFIIVLAIIIGLAFHALMYAGQPSIMAEMFPTRMRYSGVSLGYQVTSIVAGSLAPIIATTILKETGGYMGVNIYLLIASVVTLIAALSLRETKGASLHEIDAEERASRERAVPTV
ncbi:MFS family permease [Neomicrococcus aestuarii]|uniref:MFS family permease n=1 Tax=Neomicrococcus aestuarii TaxID=556325 RepID=A0A7W8TW84_9MICC|nr:MFS transporter [Neomicrococcus aestuarii]MBB5512656.1 MFS family permease [Neomicrococcus aestuarii]